MYAMSESLKKFDIKDTKRILLGWPPKIAYDGNVDEVVAFYSKASGQTQERTSFFKGKKLTSIFIYAMCLGKLQGESRRFEIDTVTKKTDERRNIDLKHFADQPEYVWMMVAVALEETKDSDGNPTMEIFKEPKKILGICEGYANGGIGDLIKLAESGGTDDQFRGYLIKLRKLIDTKTDKK